MTLSIKVKNLFGDKQKKRKLNALFAEKYQNLYRLAYAWCHQPAQAEDLVQETLLKALEKSNDIENLEHLDAFLATIMRNTFLDVMRFNKRWQWTNENEIDEFFSKDCSETEMIAQQKSECLYKAMASLPFEQREAIALVDLQGFSYQQIADITATPIGTVMSRISRGRESLLKRMKHIEKYGTNIVPLRR
ncbi:RNA polymerase sigma factor [Thiomicrorhabdus sp. Milos-T2]|uniref:RNA polymerase sigma factor n=1 Tax=Thiomicrorhabdus sp. Milos-T2 TaxID=90814 RepID=UPI000A0175F4|nr:RNA polymerase sigma factor [Thiomicrorhabdus sp. Milos-T2]